MGRQRFSSWKEIAQFLNCCEKTARRWEIQRHLPVRRVPGGAKSSVYAFRDELEKWMEGTQTEESVFVPAPELPAPPDTTASHSRRHITLIVTAALVIASIVLLPSLIRARPPRLASSGPDRLSQSNAAKLPPLVTDGRNLFFQESENNRFRIIRTALNNSSSAEPLETPLENPDPGVVAPDGSSILLRNIQGFKEDDQPLFVQPLPKGMPHRLGDILAYDAAWTPDQKHIIFSRLGSVYEATQEGTITRKLFDTPGRAYWFRWSPGGNFLRFTVYDSKRFTYRVWEVTSPGSQPHLSEFGLDPGQQQCCGAWSADGAYFVFQASVNGFFHVFAHPETSTFLSRGNQRSIQLTSGPVNYRSPLPVPGNDRLLMLRQSQKSEIVQFEERTGRWLPLLEGTTAATASYSRDGKWLAFTRLPDYTLWKCKMPGCKEPTQLTFPPQRVNMPQWSPDGSRIACMTRIVGSPWRANIVLSDGGNLTPILGGDRAEADPTWSPSGDKIAFGAVPNPNTGAEDPIQVLEFRTGHVNEVPGSTGLNSPRWSPNGRFLAAVRCGTLELAFYEFSTGNWRRLAGTRAGYLNWSADGPDCSSCLSCQKNNLV